MNKQQLANKIWASANKMRSKIEDVVAKMRQLTSPMQSDKVCLFG